MPSTGRIGTGRASKDIRSTNDLDLSNMFDSSMVRVVLRHVRSPRATRTRWKRSLTPAPRPVLDRDFVLPTKPTGRIIPAIRGSTDCLRLLAAVGAHLRARGVT